MIKGFNEFLNERTGVEQEIFLYPGAIEEIIKMYNEKKEAIIISSYEDKMDEQYVISACNASDRDGSDQTKWPWRTIFRKR